MSIDLLSKFEPINFTKNLVFKKFNLILTPFKIYNLNFSDYLMPSCNRAFFYNVM